MKLTNAPRIRKLLRENPDGMTAREIQAELGLRSMHTAYACTKAMPDTWIDRYEVVNGGYCAVFCIAIPLDDAPKPEPIRKRLAARAARLAGAVA